MGNHPRRDSFEVTLQTGDRDVKRFASDVNPPNSQILCLVSAAGFGTLNLLISSVT